MHGKSVITKCLLLVALTGFAGANANLWSFFSGPSKSSLELFMGALDEEAEEVKDKILLIGYKPPTMAEAFDEVMTRLVQRMEANPQLYDGYGKAIQIENLQSSPLRRMVSANGQVRYSMAKSLSLTNILDPESKNANLLQRHNLNKVDWEQLSQIEDKVSHLPSGDKLAFKKAMEQVSGEEVRETQSQTCKLTRRKKRDLRGVRRCVKNTFLYTAKQASMLCQRVAQAGIMLLDQFYMAPDIIFKMPYIGKELQQMRDKGMPFYEMLMFMRHQVYLYKVRTSDPDTEVDMAKVEEAHRFIGDYGLKSAVSMAKKLFEMYAAGGGGGGANEENQKEVVSRTNMAVMVSLLSKGASFAF